MHVLRWGGTRRGRRQVVTATQGMLRESLDGRNSVQNLKL
jgi:hypothetical protein